MLSLLCTHALFDSRDLTAVGRTSTFSAALTRTIVAILLADLLPGVKADCTIDRFGNEHCTLSVAARVGFGFLLGTHPSSVSHHSTNFRAQPSLSSHWLGTYAIAIDAPHRSTLPTPCRTSRTPGAYTTARAPPARPTHPNTHRRRVEVPALSPYMRTTPAQDSLRFAFPVLHPGPLTFDVIVSPLAHSRSTTRPHQARPRSSNTRCRIVVSPSRYQRETGDTSGFGR
ncbi:hypothetical protein EDB89DRAFT_1998537 [Lactarius sanguifluus]|nr:hypothetical protein EDB89DRAFT_1998537 [Lactarius sanguifluus]